MNILLLHRNFPAQFRYLIYELAKDTNNKIVFITNNSETQVNLPNVTKVVYKLKRNVPDDCHRYLRFVEEAIIHAQSAAEAAIKVKDNGFKPDIIYGHTWGQTLYMKDIFPDVPLLCYFEWFYNSKGGDIGFDGKELDIDGLAKLRTKNSHLLIDLYSCDGGITPTKFQLKQFPKEFHHKIKVLHDGVDTDFCVPDENVIFKLDDNTSFTRNDEVVTYATRGMEEYRGFPEFMRAVSVLQKKRPNMHVIIAGEDRVCYGASLANTTYKKLMLDLFDFDMSRLHFTGNLPFEKYVNLLQVSSAHVYLTYPFVVSWSCLDAMSCACPVVASKTEPVTEFIQDNYNGLLFDFFDADEQISKIEFALDNKDKMISVRNNARKTIVENYSLKELLPKHTEYIKSLINKSMI